MSVKNFESMHSSVPWYVNINFDTLVNMAHS